MKPAALPRTLTLAALALLCHAGSAHAQYSWIDDRGVRQFSDRPPPASVPASRILKQPGGTRTPTPDAAAPDASPASSPAPSAAQEPPQLTLAEKNAEFRKRKAEAAEKEKKAAEETRVAADKRRHCERARDYRRALDSGVRIGATGKDGERTFLSDEQRTAELRENDRMLAECR
ncbi:MAG TPA: DUF4124 domain-containing protein [Noviherbaspirillum sp.]|jgi:type IV secretory pathway VirB10-like protein|uniref:DUF4124 domain-containing protein n=1 Tax=Noviherbaspirillum sp. TaxID=1926288 RepID=UPI002F927BE1